LDAKIARNVADAQAALRVRSIPMAPGIERLAEYPVKLAVLRADITGAAPRNVVQEEQEIAARLRLRRIQLQRAPVAALGLLQPPEIQQRIAWVVVRLGLIRIVLDRLAIALLRFFVPAEFAKQITEIIAGARMFLA
jgi:hypothetical protein